MDTGTQTAGTRPGGVTGQRGTTPRPAGDPAGDPAAKSAQKAGTPDGDPVAKGSQKPGTPDGGPTGDAQTAGTDRKPGTGPGGQKSDEEILAEALEELRRRNAGAPGQDGPQQQEGGQPGTPGTTAQAGTSETPGQAQTDEEKVRALHRELSERFAKFDQTILTETETVRQEDAASGNRGFTDRDPFEKGGAPGEETAAIDPEATGKPSSLPGTLPGEKDPAASSTSDIPPDLVSAEGDDIIARQLREAAMKERDPELRAKLWDEYRKYKRGMK